MNRRKVILALLVILTLAIARLFVGSQIAPWPSIKVGMTRQQVAAEASNQQMDYFVLGKNDEFIVVSQKQQKLLSVTEHWMMIEFDANQVASDIRYRKFTTSP